MAKMIPPVEPEKKGEARIFRELRGAPGTDMWICLHSLDIARHRKQVEGEIDFVILVPEMGILCLELKGSTHIKVENGLWYYGYNEKGKKSPFKQVADSMYSLRDRLIKERPGFAHLPFFDAVLIPNVPVSEKSTEWQDWQLIDAGKYNAKPIKDTITAALGAARRHLSEVPSATWFNPSSGHPTLDECQQIASILRPNFESYESPKSRQVVLQEELRRYTEEQFDLLDVIGNNPRILVNGLAGTGKTLMAIEVARRSAAKGQRTLFLCFNRAIARFIFDETEPLHSMVTAMTFHDYLVNLIDARVPANAGNEFWKSWLPMKALDRLVEDPVTYDKLVVDEAPDLFFENYLEIMDLSLEGGMKSGNWVMFGDFRNQVLYSPEEVVDIKAFEIEHSVTAYQFFRNCRNTPAITKFVDALGLPGGHYRKTLRPDNGLVPEMIDVHKGTGVTELVALLERLLTRQHYRGDEIVILSPYVDGLATLLPPTWKTRLTPLDLSERGRIRFSTVYAFKGLEAPIVILTDYTIHHVTHQALLYTAATRALSQFIVLNRP